MYVTYIVRVSKDRYYDPTGISREVSVESNEDEVLLAAIPGALQVLSGLAGLAIAEKRFKIIQEETDEDSTDEG